MRKYGYVWVLLFGFLSTTVTWGAPSSPFVNFGLEVPLLDSPKLNAPAGPANSNANALTGPVTSLFERLGVYFEIYPVHLGRVRVGALYDAMYHYDLDTGRSPWIYGYSNMGLAPLVAIDLNDALFVQGGFGLNRMGFRVGDSIHYKLGTLTEASIGLHVDSILHGFSMELVAQNRVGDSTLRYALVRMGWSF